MNPTCRHVALNRLPENGHAAAFECVECHEILTDLRVSKPVLRDGARVLTLDKVP